MYDMRCNNLEYDEYGRMYCSIGRKEFGKCEKCPFNTYYMMKYFEVVE